MINMYSWKINIINNVEMIKAMPSGEQENFRLIMDAFRTRAYVDARAINPSDHVSNPSQAELSGLYVELAAKGVNVNAANFDQYLNNTLIPNLSVTLNINPGLVRTLLNQITTFERAFASVDDIRELGFDPVMNNYGNIYAPPPGFPLRRNLNFTRNLINDIEQAQGQ